jgi:hypothetical protein
LDVLVTKFADDTKGARIIPGTEDRDKLQAALDCLCRWADKWGMIFNVAKCKILHIGRNNPGYSYYMNGVEVSTTEMERDVGVVVNRNLKPMDQCEAAAQKKFPLQGPPHIHQALQTICASPPRVCSTGMVALAKGRH